MNCFVKDGFCNWKNALAKLDEHERSEMYKEAMVKLEASSTHVGLMHSIRSAAPVHVDQATFKHTFFGLAGTASMWAP